MRNTIKVFVSILLAFLITVLLCISILRYDKLYTKNDINVAYANGQAFGETTSEEALSGIRSEFNSADENLRNEFNNADEELRNEFNSANENLRNELTSSTAYYNHYISISFSYSEMEELNIYNTIEVTFNIINRDADAFTHETLYSYLALNFNDANKKYINGNSDTLATNDAGIITEKKLYANTNIAKIQVMFQIITFSIEDGILTSKGTHNTYEITNRTVIRDNVIQIV